MKKDVQHPPFLFFPLACLKEQEKNMIQTEEHTLSLKHLIHGLL